MIQANILSLVSFQAHSRLSFLQATPVKSAFSQARETLDRMIAYTREAVLSRWHYLLVVHLPFVVFLLATGPDLLTFQ